MGRIQEQKLIDERPLLLLPSLAQALGLNKAIILNQLHYWLIKNKNKERNFRDGHYWTYNSIEKWQEQFPFWNSRTIERTLWKLEADGIVKTSNHNKLNLDRTKWYRIDYARLIEVLRIGHNGLFDSDRMSQWLGQYVTMDTPTESDNMSPPIPETNTETNIQRLSTETNGNTNTIKDELKNEVTAIKDNIPTTDNGGSASASLRATATPPESSGTALKGKPDWRKGRKPGTGKTQLAIAAYFSKHKTGTPKDISEDQFIDETGVRNCLSQHKRLYQTVSRGVYALRDAGETPNTPPLTAEGSPALKTQNDSVESHSGASKVEPVEWQEDDTPTEDNQTLDTEALVDKFITLIADRGDIEDDTLAEELNYQLDTSEVYRILKDNSKYFRYVQVNNNWYLTDAGKARAKELSVIV